MSANYLKVFSMSSGINRWCMIILMSKCSTWKMWGFTRRRTNFKVQKGHTESINKFHHGSSLRERERERERDRERIIMYGKYPGQYIDCMIYSDQTVRKYSRHVIYVCFKIGPFLSFLYSRKTYSGRSFSLISLSFYNAAKEQTYYMTLFATSPLLPVYSVLYWSMRR